MSQKIKKQDRMLKNRKDKDGMLFFDSYLEFYKMIIFGVCFVLYLTNNSITFKKFKTCDSMVT